MAVCKSNLESRHREVPRLHPFCLKVYHELPTLSEQRNGERNETSFNKTVRSTTRMRNKYGFSLLLQPRTEESLGTITEYNSAEAAESSIDSTSTPSERQSIRRQTVFGFQSDTHVSDRQ